MRDLPKLSKIELSSEYIKVTAGEARTRFAEVIDYAGRQNERIVVTEYGRPAAAIVSVSDLNKIEEFSKIDWDTKIQQSFVNFSFQEIFTKMLSDKSQLSDASEIKTG
jgi:prevent-host-death family protein